jgi:hypothetical protein
VILFGEFGTVLITGLLIFCLIDVLFTDEHAVRNLPKLGWLLLVLFFPLIGSIAWLVAGRPEGGHSRAPRSKAPWPATRTAGFPEYERPARGGAPDDDPEFLRRIAEEQARADAEHLDVLRKWEADLRRREEQLRAESPPPSDRAPERDAE